MNTSTVVATDEDEVAEAYRDDIRGRTMGSFYLGKGSYVITGAVAGTILGVVVGAAVGDLFWLAVPIGLVLGAATGLARRWLEGFEYVY